MWPIDFDNERLPEIVSSGPKRLCFHFRLSVVVAIAQGQFLRAGRGRKPHICRWNCHPTGHGLRDISISGFNGSNAISGCRTLSQSLRGTLFELTMVRNTRLAVVISTLFVVVPVV